MRSRRAALVVVLTLGASVAPALAAAPKKTPRPGSARLDFSGTWVLDPKVSVNVSSRMRDAVLNVTQTGDRIFIAPATPKMQVMAEEIVADGQPYEKALGTGQKAIVRAAWAPDGGSLRVEITAGDSHQRSVWKLSTDRTVWVRDTSTLDHGARRNSRLVFRKQAAGVTRTPAAN
jgi:hypothetical protein